MNSVLNFKSNALSPTTQLFSICVTQPPKRNSSRIKKLHPRHSVAWTAFNLRCTTFSLHLSPYMEDSHIKSLSAVSYPFLFFNRITPVPHQISCLFEHRASFFCQLYHFLLETMSLFLICSLFTSQIIFDDLLGPPLHLLHEVDNSIFFLFDQIHKI